MERSIDLMRPFGRFLELGKRDFYANTKVGLRPFRRNVSYFGIDADQLLTYRPDVVRSVFREIVEGFADGTFTPLPHRVFNDREVVDAFRLMQKSGHIGKILVKAPPADAGMDVSDREFLASPDGTHILVGGTGGFGLEMARWLADRGARHILLTSRSGGGGETLDSLIGALAKRGVSLKVARCDVTDRAALSTLLTSERAKRPISGVAHTAMVLDDGLIRNLTPDRIQAVLAPKVTGAAILDELTRDDQLDYFVLFSSAAAMFGNPGQANYTAANGYLDGLARQRAARGLNATAVAWGAISDVGVLTRQKDTAESLARHTGGVEFRARDGLNLLARILVRDDTRTACNNIALATMNWSMAGEVLGIMQTPAYDLIRREAKSGGGDHGEQVDIRAAIQGLDDNAARGVLADYLAREVAAIFRMPVEDISLKRSLADIGMDSLMGLELRMAAQRGLGIDIPIVSISDGTTINDIASRVLTRLRGGPDDEEAPTSTRNALIEKHISEDLDEADIDRLEKQVEKREAGLHKVV
jgi:NAD(P)-dependent dehydrogenase (short-subunit alcohol dehydrogenase family)